MMIILNCTPCTFANGYYYTPVARGAHLENATEAWEQDLRLHLRRYSDSVQPQKST
jgi:hypothetical protein